MPNTTPKALPPIPENKSAKFISLVQQKGPDECWPWKGAFHHEGYGTFVYAGRNVRANRVALFLNGTPGEDFAGKIVLHSCDNPACVNPAHLSLGTYQQNNDDMIAKGRMRRGSRRPLSKLTETDIPQIFALSKQGISRGRIAAIFSVSKCVISQVLSRKLWKHVDLKQSVPLGTVS